MLADFEENFGLLSKAFDQYDLLTQTFPSEMQLWDVYLSKVMTYQGIIRCRQVFQKALKVLTDTNLVMIGLRFAKLERKLNEIERARAIYVHLTQYCDPSSYEKTFWKVFENFELQYGNKDTYEDFLRSRRQQELRYSVMNPSEPADQQLKEAAATALD